MTQQTDRAQAGDSEQLAGRRLVMYPVRVPRASRSAQGQAGTRRRRLTRFEKILLAAVAILTAALLLVLIMGTPALAWFDAADVSRAGQAAVANMIMEGDGSPVSGQQSTADSRRLDVAEISLQGKKIIVDAGHGGPDCGCTGVSGRLEKEVNLEIAQCLQKRLEEEGVTVIMTRETDDAIAPTKEEDMAKRAKIIETSRADAFISIHQNEFQDSTVAGPQVFYAYQGTPGKKLACAVQDMLNEVLQPEVPRMALDVPYDLLQPGGQPSCTVECGFFSNPEEEALLQTAEYQDKLADCITDGIKLYYQRAES